jgi:hypothetical protein
VDGLYVIDLTLATPIRGRILPITSLVQRGIYSQPTWSPDGARLALTSRNRLRPRHLHRRPRRLSADQYDAHRQFRLLAGMVARWPPAGLRQRPRRVPKLAARRSEHL